MQLRGDCASISFPRKSPQNPCPAEERRTADRNQTLPSPPAGPGRDLRLGPGMSSRGPRLGQEQCSKQSGRSASPSVRRSTAPAEMCCSLRRWRRVRRSGRSKFQAGPREHPRSNPSRRRRPGAPSRLSFVSRTPRSGYNKVPWKQRFLRKLLHLPDSRTAAVHEREGLPRPLDETHEAWRDSPLRRKARAGSNLNYLFLQLDQGVNSGSR